MPLASLLAALALAAAPPPKKIAVMDLAATGVEPALAQAVSLVVPTELRGRLPGAQIISKDEISAMLGLEKTRQMLGCTGDDCATALGGALGVDELVDGRIGKVGQTYVIELRRIDVRGGKTLASAARMVRGADDDLVRATQDMLDEVFPGTHRTGNVKAIAPYSGWEPTFLQGRGAAWTGVGAGVALLAAGGVGVWWSLDVHSKWSKQQSGDRGSATVTRDQADQAKLVNPLGWGAVAVGAVMAGWGTWRLTHPEAGTGVAVAPLPGGAAVALGGTF
ncbi:MAG TPA: hypothetical protein VLU43_13235 [Anaeromyxobacteraceae bacterium]|nr:hypothetical protein [Anaeromyxobacteraceae bacterium]